VNMKTTCRRYVRATSVALVSAILFAGCAVLPTEKSEAAVSVRALGYWNAMITHDWEKAYSYATPAYRQAIDLYGFRKKNDGFIKHKAAEVFSVTCDEPEVCKVKMKLRFAIELDKPDELATVIEERWVRESGQWYRYAEF
jgi:hypothetical protein